MFIKPVYLENSEIQNDRNDRIKDFEIAEKLSIKVNDIKCTQLDRDLWRIYGGSQASRSTLVTGGFELRERNIQVYADNPFSTAIGNPNENVLKVTVKGDPFQFVTLKSTLFYFFIMYTRIVQMRHTFILWGASFKEVGSCYQTY